MTKFQNSVLAMSLQTFVLAALLGAVACAPTGDVLALTARVSNEFIAPVVFGPYFVPSEQVGTQRCQNIGHMVQMVYAWCR